MCSDCSVSVLESQTGNKTHFDCCHHVPVWGCAWAAHFSGARTLVGTRSVSAGDSTVGTTAHLASAASASAQCHPGSFLWEVCDEAGLFLVPQGSQPPRFLLPFPVALSESPCWWRER